MILKIYYIQFYILNEINLKYICKICILNLNFLSKIKYL